MWPYVIFRHKVKLCLKYYRYMYSMAYYRQEEVLYRTIVFTIPVFIIPVLKKASITA